MHFRQPNQITNKKNILKIATDIISSSFVTLGIEVQVESIALWDIEYAILCSVLFCKCSN